MWRCSCFGISLRKNVLILCVIDVIIAIISLTFGTIGLVDVWNHKESILPFPMRKSETVISEIGGETTAKSKKSFTMNSKEDVVFEDQETELIIAIVVIIILTINLAFYAMNLILGIYLSYGTVKKNRDKCQHWFTLTLVIWVITLICFLINIISIKGQFPRGRSHSYFSTSAFIFNLLYKAYALWLVRCYVNLLRFNNARIVTDYNASMGDVKQDEELAESLTRNLN